MCKCNHDHARISVRAYPNYDQKYYIPRLFLQTTVYPFCVFSDLVYVQVYLYSSYYSILISYKELPLFSIVRRVGGVWG